MPETWFRCHTPCFGVWQTFSQLWGHFWKCFSWGIKKCESLVALNGAPKRFHRPKNIWFDLKFKSVVCSEPKSEFHYFNLGFSSYSPSNLFSAFRWAWGSWKSSQMICHIPKHGVWHLSQVSSMFWNKVIISLHEDVLDLQRPLHLVLDLQIELRLTKMVPHDSPCQKTWGLTPKSSLQHVQNQINNFTPWRRPWPPTVPEPCSWPSERSEAHTNGPIWFPMIPYAKKHGVWHQNQVSDSN